MHAHTFYNARPLGHLLSSKLKDEVQACAEETTSAHAHDLTWVPDFNWIFQLKKKRQARVWTHVLRHGNKQLIDTLDGSATTTRFNPPFNPQQPFTFKDFIASNFQTFNLRLVNFGHVNFNSIQNNTYKRGRWIWTNYLKYCHIFSQ